MKDFKDKEFDTWFEQEICSDICREYFENRQEWAVEIYEGMYLDTLQETYDSYVEKTI